MLASSAVSDVRLCRAADKLSSGLQRRVTVACQLVGSSPLLVLHDALEGVHEGDALAIMRAVHECARRALPSATLSSFVSTACDVLSVCLLSTRTKRHQVAVAALPYHRTYPSLSQKVGIQAVWLEMLDHRHDVLPACLGNILLFHLWPSVCPFTCSLIPVHCVCAGMGPLPLCSVSSLPQTSAAFSHEPLCCVVARSCTLARQGHRQYSCWELPACPARHCTPLWSSSCASSTPPLRCRTLSALSMCY